MNRYISLAVLACLSCGGASQPRRELPQPLVPIAMPVAEINVESRGQEPVLLRYRSAGGRSLLRMSTKIEDQFSLALVTTVEAKKRGEEYRVTAQLLGADVDAKGPPFRSSESLQRAASMLIGLETVIDIDDRGVASALAIGLDGHDLSKVRTIATAREQFAQLIVPLPREAVGKGATWTATGPAAFGTDPLVQVTRYHLIEIKGSKVTLALEINQQGEEMTSVGTGKVIIDLDNPTAVELDMKQKITVKSGQTLEGTIRIEVLDESITKEYPSWSGSFPFGFRCPRGTKPRRGNRPEPMFVSKRGFPLFWRLDSSDEELTHIYDALWCELPSGTKNGPYWSLQGNGKLGTRGAFLRGKRTGMWTFLRGQLSAEARYKHGKRVGKWTLSGPDWGWRHDPPEIVVRTWNWKNGLLHGRETTSYPRGSEGEYSSSVDWKDGKRHGVERIEGDGVIYGGRWNDGKKHGKWTERYEDFTVVDTYHQGELSGPYKARNDKGTIISEGNMRHGKKDGRWLDGGRSCMYKAGRPQEDCDITPSHTKVKDELHGPIEQRLDNGLVVTGTYHHGAATGVWTFFHPNGSKAAMGQFALGRRVGVWDAYDTNGRLTHHSRCGDGAPSHDEAEFEPFMGAYLVLGTSHCTLTTFEDTDGLKSVRSPTRLVRYHKNGTRAEEGPWQGRGIHIGKWTTWREDGSLKTILLHEGMLFHRTLYDNKGRKRQEGRFVDERPTGVHRSWDARGRLLSHIEYRGGLPHGKAAIYDMYLRTTRNVEFVLGQAVSIDPAMCHDEEVLKIDWAALPGDTLELKCVGPSGDADGAKGEWTLAGYPKSFVFVGDDGTKQSMEVEGDLIVVEKQGESITQEDGEIREYKIGEYRQSGASTLVWRTHYPTGVIATNLALRSGTGTYRAYYPDGNVREEGQFDSGHRTGTWRGYFSDRTLRYTAEPSGLVCEYYQSGAIQAIVPRFSTQRSPLARGLFDRAEYYPNGRRKSMLGTAHLATTLKKWVNLKDRKHSHLVRWWDDGTLAYLGKRESGEFWSEGKLLLFSAADEPTAVQVNRRFDSEAIKVTFRQGAVVRGEGSLMQGSRTGRWKFYDPMGRLRLEGDYSGGAPSHEWTSHHMSGTFTIPYIFLGQECIDGQMLPEFVAYEPTFDPFLDMPQRCDRDSYMETYDIRSIYDRLPDF